MADTIKHDTTLGSIYCARCDSPLNADYSTNDGRLIEFVQPCEKCLREVAMANALPAFASMTANLTPASRVEHGALAPRTKRICPDCGARRHRKKGQKRLARCESCRKTHRAKYASEYRLGYYFKRRYGADWRIAVCRDCGDQHERKKNAHRTARCPKCIKEKKLEWREKYAEERRISRAVERRLEEARHEILGNGRGGGGSLLVGVAHEPRSTSTSTT